MSKWTKTINDTIFGYEEELRDSLPSACCAGFFAVSYDDLLPPLAQEADAIYIHEDEVARAIEAFVERWGDLSDERFIHVLRHVRCQMLLIYLHPFWKALMCWKAMLLQFCWDSDAMSALEEYVLADAPTIEVEYPHTPFKIFQVCCASAGSKDLLF